MNKFITAIILIIVGVGLIVTYARSNYEQYQAVNKRSAEYDSALSLAGRLTDLQDDLNQQYQNIPIDQRERLEKLLPTNIDTVRLTVEIDKIASDNSVVISDLEFATNNDNNQDEDLSLEASDEPEIFDEDQNYSSVDMAFKAIGDYEMLNNFIADLENNLRLTDIQSLNVDVVTDDNNAMIYDLVIRTYWLGI
jgi:hypothetical protein